jgi:uncharacterized protein (DUF4415 family)
MKKEYDFSKMKRAEPKYLKKLKAPVTIRLDPQILAYFIELSASTGFPYESLTNDVLKEYALLGLKPSAHWK